MKVFDPRGAAVLARMGLVCNYFDGSSPRRKSRRSLSTWQRIGRENLFSPSISFETASCYNPPPTLSFSPSQQFFDSLSTRTVYLKEIGAQF